MLRHLTKDEIIEHLRVALQQYALPANWSGSTFLPGADINQDICSALFECHGEIARQALHHDETMRIVSPEDLKPAR
jgi:hypothetical protein